jgi:hypothetical protein
MQPAQIAVRQQQQLHSDGPIAVADERHARTLMLLEAPIASTLIMLAAPTLLVNIAQSAVGVIETYFIGKLGTDALAGVALVFPVVMLAQMMSAGLAWDCTSRRRDLAVCGGPLSPISHDSQLRLAAGGLRYG